MKKIRRIITMLFAGALILSLASCDLLSKMGEGLKDDFSKWWGDPAAEGNELKCGISHSMTVSGTLTYLNTKCDHIDLDPNFGLRGKLTSYNVVDNENIYEYEGEFFYKENPEDLEKGELWIYIQRVWDKEDNKWASPIGTLRYDDRKNDKPYFKAENVNLTTNVTVENIDLTHQVTYEEYEAAHDEMVKYIQIKHRGSSDTTGIERENIFEEEEREDRFGFIERFENALNSHNPSSTTVVYEKVNNVFTYVATIDGETLELMIFSDDELFFYPYADTKDDFTLGMYSYNHACYYDDNKELDYKKNPAARKWIREHYTKIGSLYNELMEKAATAKAEAKKKAEAEYEASKNN